MIILFTFKGQADSPLRIMIATWRTQMYAHVTSLLIFTYDYYSGSWWNFPILAATKSISYFHCPFEATVFIAQHTKFYRIPVHGRACTPLAPLQLCRLQCNSWEDFERHPRSGFWHSDMKIRPRLIINRYHINWVSPPFIIITSSGIIHPRSLILHGAWERGFKCFTCLFWC